MINGQNADEIFSYLENEGFVKVPVDIEELSGFSTSSSDKSLKSLVHNLIVDIEG